MKKPALFLKVNFITGLDQVVKKELNKYSNLEIIKKEDDIFYLNFTDNLEKVKQLRSVTRVFLVAQSKTYNPAYLSKHKSILNHLIGKILEKNKNQFKTFKITCAGANSPEVQSIANYIKDTYQLIPAEEADLKLHIILKSEGLWEIGAQITPRPLSFREYKIKNISGAMDPTIAYAMNSLSEIKKAKTYLNVFSGSGTLLIEAGQTYPHLEKLIGFDNDKKHLSVGIQNIKQAGLIKNITLKEANIFDSPYFGKFDIITADLPFGMVISKGDNLEELYRAFITCCEKTINPKGFLAVYTSQYEMLEKIISTSKFKITKILNLKFTTSAKTKLKTKIFICQLKNTLKK